MTKTFVLVRHTAQDMRAAKTHTQDSMTGTVSIALQSWGYDYQERQVLGGDGYISNVQQVDAVIDRLQANLEELRKEARGYLSNQKP